MPRGGGKRKIKKFVEISLHGPTPPGCHRLPMEEADGLSGLPLLRHRAEVPFLVKPVARPKNGGDSQGDGEISAVGRRKVSSIAWRATGESVPPI